MGIFSYATGDGAIADAKLKWMALLLWLKLMKPLQLYP